MPSVVVLRGHQANPWELRPWELIRDRYDVTYLRSSRNWFDLGLVDLPARPVRTMRGLLPPGRIGDAAVRLPGDRYLGLDAALRGADIVHAQELGYWYSMQAARLKERHRYRLVLTVWETLPFMGAQRNVRTRRYREWTLRETDLFLAATERARDCLIVEGAAAERIRVCPPGVDLERFGAPAEPGGERFVVAPGRLEWEKGHQDLLRALALLRREGKPVPRAVIVGRGPEEAALRAYAADLGVDDLVELRGFVPYDEMPGLFARASAMVLASIPVRFWEEQFGMVLVEAMAAGVPVIATTTGAIPEVTGGDATQIGPGDWVGLARALAEPRERRRPDRVEAFGAGAAAERLADAYDELLSAR